MIGASIFFYRLIVDAHALYTSNIVYYIQCYRATKTVESNFGRANMCVYSDTHARVYVTTEESNEYVYSEAYEYRSANQRLCSRCEGIAMNDTQMSNYQWTTRRHG